MTVSLAVVPKWIQQEAWCAATGWPPATITRWRESGELIEGKHWINSRRRVLISPVAMDEFFEKHARLGPTAA